MIEVQVRGDIEDSIRELKRLIKRDGSYLEMKRRLEAPKRSQRRRMKDSFAARRKWRSEKRRAQLEKRKSI